MYPGDVMGMQIAKVKDALGKANALMAPPWRALALSAALAALLPAAAEARDCVIERMTGRDLQVSTGGGWRSVRTGDELSASTRIRTGANARIQLRCDDRTVVTVGPSSLVDIGTLVGRGEENVLMRITNGIVGIVAPGRTWQSFRVKAPTLIASVRSTTWLVEASRERNSVFVREGSVDVRTSSGAGATLQPGEGIDADRSGTTSGKRRWGAARVAAAERRLGLNWR